MKISDSTIRQAIDDGLAGVCLSPGQKAAILAQCRPAPLHVRRGRALKRVLTVAAVFMLAVAMSAGVLAASPALAYQLSVLGAQTMRFLQPVNRSSEQDGIRMEVLAAMRSQDTAVVYLSLSDTTGQGRIKDDLKLWDYEISGAALSSGYQVSYDEATGEAIVCLTGEGLAGNKLTVTLHDILTGVAELEPRATGYTVADLQRLFPDPALEYPHNVSGWTLWGDGMEQLDNRLSAGTMPLLKAQCSYVPEGAPWLTFQAAGLVGDELHLRLEQDDEMGRFNTLSFSLAAPGVDMTNAGGATVQLGHEPAREADFSGPQEYVLTLPQGVPLDQIELYAGGIVYGEHLEGDWNVTFRLEEAAASRCGTCPVDLGGWSIDQVQLSPIGLSVVGTGEMYADSRDVTVKVTRADGAEVNFLSSSTCTTMEGEIVMRMLFDVPVAPDEIAEVTVCGTPVQWASPAA